MTQQYLMLQREGYLIRSSLTTGLHSMRRATFADLQACYTALFQLSIGTERLLKVTLILDHFHRTGFDAGANFRRFGHKLLDLYGAAKAVSAHYDEQLPDLDSVPLSKEILSLLHIFADGRRYYNLDNLLTRTTDIDPLKQWKAILQAVAQSELRQRLVRQATIESITLEQLLGGMLVTEFSDLDGSSLNNRTIHFQAQIQTAAARYAVWHTVVLLSAIERLMSNASYQAMSRDCTEHADERWIPTMSEFLPFLSLDRGDVLRRSSWLFPIR